MLQRKHNLVGRNFLDVLFRGVPAPWREEARGLCQNLGYDPEHAHAFYPASVALACANALGEMLMPGATRGRQQYELGKAAALGYAQTVPGQMREAHQPHQPLAVMRYYAPLLHHELTAAHALVTEAGEQGCAVEVTGFPLHPAFFSGSLTQLLCEVGCREPECRYELAEEQEYSFTVRWQSQPC